MKLFDITRPLTNGMRVYSQPESFALTRTHEADRDGYNLSLLKMGAHCGTHIDAPAHFLEGGKTIEQIPLHLLRGEARVITVSDDSTFEDVPQGTVRLLMRAHAFHGLTQAQAHTLIGKGVQLLGTDGLSCAPEYNESAIHKLLLGRGVWLLENLTLESVADGRYQLTCLPLNIPGCEAAPARAVLEGMD